MTAKRIGRGGKSSWPSFRLGLGCRVVLVLGLMFGLGAIANAKDFKDSLTTDFYGGTEDNVQINQNIQGGLQLSPYYMLSNWTSASGPTSALYLTSSVVYNGKIYVSGGKGAADSTSSVSGSTADTALNNIHYGNISADGSVEKWDPDKLVTLPQPTYGHASLVYNGRFYIFGGRTANSNTLDTVYWGKITGHDGQIKALYQPNTWTAVAPLPMPLFRPAAVRFERWVYIIGGVNASDIAQSTVYFAAVEPDGNIPQGAWQTTSAPLPLPLSGHNAVISNGRVYIIGGSTSGQPLNSQNQIFLGSINPLTGDIAAWTPTTPLPEPLFDAASAVAGGKIWVCGGATSTTARATNVVYFASINQTDGQIPGPNARDTWTRGTDLPTPVKWHNFVAFNNHLLVIGGTNNSGTQKQVLTANLVDNKQNISSWLPTTPMFLTSYNSGERPIWTGHSAALKVPLVDQNFSTSKGNQPVIYVIGGGPNTFAAYATGTGDTINSAAALSTVYRANVDSNGSLQAWASDSTNGTIPMATVFQSSTMAISNQVYVIGGANSANAVIFAGAASRSDTAFYGTTPTGWYQGHTDVFYENIGAGSTTGNFEGTSFIPLRDPNWTTGTAGGVSYQPLIRSAAVSFNDVIYVLGGISRVNRLPVVSHPALGTSDPDVQDKVWYCLPNPSGIIDPENGPGGWKTTTALPRRMYDMTAVVANKRIYVLGGRDSTMFTPPGGGVNVFTPNGNPLNTVYFADINANGTLGAWNITTPMLLSLGEHACVFTSGRLYVMGGSSDAAGGTLQNRVFYCMPNAATGQIPTTGFFGSWEFTTTSLEHPVAGHQAVTSNGYIYVLGGRYGEPHSSNTYFTSIADVAYRTFQSYAWAGTYERFIDLDKDQFVNSLDWQALPNNEIVSVKCRTAMERGPWTDWTQELATGPLLVQKAMRYLHYKITLQTGHNAPGTSATPLVNQVTLNYFPSKRLEEDCFQINHNKFDPQVEPLMVTFKTRDNSVSNVILRVYNLEGELIRRQDIDIPPTTPLPATGFWQWDGTNENTEFVANGVYIVQYNCGDTHKIRKVVVFKH